MGCLQGCLHQRFLVGLDKVFDEAWAVRVWDPMWLCLARLLFPEMHIPVLAQDGADELTAVLKRTRAIHSEELFWLLARIILLLVKLTSRVIEAATNGLTRHSWRLL